MSSNFNWVSLYQVGGVTGEEYLLFFTLILVSFGLIKVRLQYNSMMKTCFALMATFLAGVIINGRLESFTLEQTLDSSADVIILEGKLIKAENINTYDPYIGEKVIIETVELFRPSPTHHATKVGCWKGYISDSKDFAVGDELRIHYLWLKGEGPTAMVEGEIRPLDIPCILKVEKRSNA